MDSKSEPPHSSEAEVSQFQLAEEQMEKIRADIAQSQPMVGFPEPVNCLLPLYKDAHLPGFVQGIEYLNGCFHHMRRIRGDGNCFYRALWFGYLEKLLVNYSSGDEDKKARASLERERMVAKIKGSLQELIAVGYPEFALESFHEELMEILDGLFGCTLEELEAMFQEGGRADYLTWYMRVLTAGHLKLHCDRFQPFVEGCFVDMDTYCKAEVEPMNKECEQLQILALTEYLDVQADIAYLDGRISETQGVARVRIPETCRPDVWTVQLLYRPGHYDLLYLC